MAPRFISFLIRRSSLIIGLMFLAALYGHTFSALTQTAPIVLTASGGLIGAVCGILIGAYADMYQTRRKGT